jgi:hypothetical protein
VRPAITLTHLSLVMSPTVTCCCHVWQTKLPSQTCENSLQDITVSWCGRGGGLVFVCVCV